MLKLIKNDLVISVLVVSLATWYI